MVYKGILKEHSGLLSLLFPISDGVIVFVTGWFAFYVSGVNEFFISIGEPGIPTRYIYVLVLTVVLTAAMFPLFSVYRAWRDTSIFAEIKLLTWGWLAVAFALSALALMTKTGAQFSRMWAGVWLLIGWVALVTYRILSRLLLRWMRSKGYNRRQIVIAGAGELAKQVAEKINSAGWMGLEIVGFFSENGVHGINKTSGQTRVFGDLSALPTFIENNVIDQIWIAMPLKEEGTVKALMRELRHSTADIRFIPDIFSFQLLNHSITDIAGLPVIYLSVTPMDGVNRLLKAVEERVLAFMILLFTSPKMLLIALGIKLSSKGPMFYRQERVSWNGEPFTMLKFRSMPVDSEVDTGPIWAKKGEQRATWLGSLLRKTSLDELPQFINVLKGEKSIVGPCPERTVFVDQFKDEVPDYMKKHMVKAGITGWAQVNGWRGDTDLKKRVEHDLYYIDTGRYGLI
jgi:putative colanic acid biosynthesis UDP-glucose lipid carrier transferase